jgi:ABC-2 type transport system permease protein
MVKPVSRAAIMTSKLVAAFLNVMVINVVTLVSFLVVVPLYSKGGNASGEILTMILSMFIVQLIFMSLGAVLAAWMKHPRASGSVATGILFTAYFVARITDMSDKLRFLNLISPFKYFDLGRMAAGNGLNFGVVLLSLGLVAAFCVLTYVFYQKRDLTI